MSSYQKFCDTQTQAGPSLLTHNAVLSAEERCEELFSILHGNAHTGIKHVDLQGISVQPGLQCDPSLLRVFVSIT